MLVVIDPKQTKVPTTCADCFLNGVCAAYAAFVQGTELVTNKRIPDVRELPGCMIVCTLPGSVPDIPKGYLFDRETGNSYVYRNKHTGEEMHISKRTGTILDDVTLQIVESTKQLKEQIMKDFYVRR